MHGQTRCVRVVELLHHFRVDRVYKYSVHGLLVHNGGCPKLNTVHRCKDRILGCNFFVFFWYYEYEHSSIDLEPFVYFFPFLKKICTPDQNLSMLCDLSQNYQHLFEK